MLEIVQPGQAGKTGLLLDMHRLRKRVFGDRLNWAVSVTPGGLEIDAFDLPDAIYLLALNDDKRVIGNWRLLPTNGPTMVRNVWPHFLDSIDMPRNAHVWEASRFAVETLEKDPGTAKTQSFRAIQEMFCGLTELCILCGIERIFTLYDMRIARLLKKLDCLPEKTSAKMLAGDCEAQVSSFVTDEKMLDRLRKASGIQEELIAPDMLPPLLVELQNKFTSN